MQALGPETNHCGLEAISPVPGAVAVAIVCRGTRKPVYQKKRHTMRSEEYTPITDSDEELFLDSLTMRDDTHHISSLGK